jgi:hypothetical protein
MELIADTSGPVRSYQALSLVTALLFFAQPILAGQFQYNDKPDLLDAHSIVAHAVLLLLALQTLIALVARRAFGLGLVALNFLIFILTGAQIGFGFAAEDNEGRLAIHLPLGVTLVLLAFAAVLFGWFDLRGQPATAEDAAARRGEPS